MEESTRLTIRTVSLAARCEVCHQADFFDPVSNKCARCENIAITYETFFPLVHAPATAHDLSDEFWDLLFTGARTGLLGGGVACALSSLTFWIVPSHHPIRNVIFFTGLGFFLGLLAGVVRRGGNEDTLRITAYNAAYAFVFGGLISGALFFINCASPNLNALDFIRFLLFCFLGSTIFAMSGGFVGAVLSVLIPPHHPLRRAPHS